MTRGPAVVIPVKATVGAKQRLATRLGGEERRMLALALASDTLRAVAAVVAPQRCCVVTGDEEVARLAARHGMNVIPERGAGQSAAVRVGTGWAHAHGYTAVATLAADCPMLGGEDVEALVDVAARRGRFFACAPDAEGTGTNAAALRPLDVDPWRFGAASLKRHRAAAAEAGLRFSVVDLPSLRLDCDRPIDLAQAAARPRPTATFQLLRQLGVARRAAAG